MKAITSQSLQKSGVIAILASAVLAAVAFLMPDDTAVNPAFVVAVAFVLALFGLFLVLRPHIPKKVAFIGAVVSYMALIVTTMVALNFNEEAVAMGGYAIGFVAFLAILSKLFLLLGVSHIVFPGKSSEIGNDNSHGES